MIISSRDHIDLICGPVSHRALVGGDKRIVWAGERTGSSSVGEASVKGVEEREGDPLRVSAGQIALVVNGFQEMIECLHSSSKLIILS